MKIALTLLVIVAGGAQAAQDQQLLCSSLASVGWIENSNQIGMLRKVEGLEYNQEAPYRSPFEMAERDLQWVVQSDDSRISEGYTHKLQPISNSTWPGFFCASSSPSKDWSSKGIIIECFDLTPVEDGDPRVFVFEAWRANHKSQIEYLYGDFFFGAPIFGLALDSPDVIMDYGTCNLF